MNQKEKTKLQREIVEGVYKNPHGLLLLSPRLGKTKIAIDLIKKNKYNSILWVTPSTKLRDEDIPAEFELWKAKRYLNKTDIICYSSLSKQVGEYDLVILDEYQEITGANSLPFFVNGIKYKYILGLSGTHPKHDEKLEIYKKLGLKILKEITIDEAVELDMVADYEINVIEANMNNKDKTIDGGTKKNPFKTTEQAQYDYLSKTVTRLMFTDKKRLQFAILNRMRFIYNSTTKFEIAKTLLKELKGRKIIFTGSIEQAEQLSDHTYHSKTNKDDLDKFQREEIETLALVKAGGTGFTYKNVENFIIMQADSNKKGEFIQKLTRSLLKQHNYKAKIWIICLLNTQDEKWVANALQSLNQKKIKYINVKNLNQEL